MKFIFYGWQDILEEDISVVVDVLKFDFLIQGLCVLQFEQVIVDYVGVKYVVVVNSVMFVFYIVCLVLGLKKGDWFWILFNIFVVLVNCVFYCDVNVSFVDIDL